MIVNVINWLYLTNYITNIIKQSVKLSSYLVYHRCISLYIPGSYVSKKQSNIYKKNL